MEKKQYIKNFKENYAVVIPRTFLLIMFTFLTAGFYLLSMRFIDSIKDPTGQVLSTIILLGVFLKVILYLDLGNLISNVGTDWYDALVYGSVENRVKILTEEETYKQHIINKIISEYEKKKDKKK